MSKKRNEKKLLLKNKDNRKWYVKNWGIKLFSYFTAFVSVWTILDAFNINFTTLVEELLPGGSLVILIVASIACLLVAGYQCIHELKGYSHLRVETERSGCSVEIRVPDSFLTNAFDNYPNSDMIIGINKAFWFKEAAPNSLVSDMWKKLEEKNIKKEDVQKSIDQALEKLWNKEGVDKEKEKAKYIDDKRPRVYVKCDGLREERQPCIPNCKYNCALKNANKNSCVQSECRDNYKIGTVVCVNLTWVEPAKEVLQPLGKLFPAALKSKRKRMAYNLTVISNKILGVKRESKEKEQKPLGIIAYIRKNRYKVVQKKECSKKLYLIANSEVVQGQNMNEPMKVTFDRRASVVENFPQIWKYFEEQEGMTPMPPEHIMYQPLLMPLIGAGVANEGYSDLEIFSKIVDLYYENLRRSVRVGKHPVIPNLIINIQSKTAIETSGIEDANGRKIDLKTAFWYLKYRNKVSPVVDKVEDKEDKEEDSGRDTKDGERK